MFEQIIPYARPLVIGTGGGNDIVSSTLVLYDLIKSGRKADLAGMCSPGAWHLYDEKEEFPVNLVTKNTKRYRPSKVKKYLSFIDSKVPSLLKEHGVDAKVFNLSCRYGTTKFIEGLQELINEQGYDGIVAVDVGGDILARGKKDSMILSPLMDFSSLYVISKLSLPSKLIEFGLQTDGELRPQSCEEILIEEKKRGALEGVIEINENNEAVKFFEKVYRGIENIRQGHTANMTLKTLREKEDINTIYRARIQILDKKWYHEFPITLEAKYFGKAFIFDLKKVAENRSFAFPYETPLELYLKMKSKIDSKTEMDMLYAWSEKKCIWLGLLCPQIQGELRREIIRYGLENMKGHADLALLWIKDIGNLSEGWIGAPIEEFIITTQYESLPYINEVSEEITNILK